MARMLAVQVAINLAAWEADPKFKRRVRREMGDAARQFADGQAVLDDEYIVVFDSDHPALLTREYKVRRHAQ